MKLSMACQAHRCLSHLMDGSCAPLSYGFIRNGVILKFLSDKYQETTGNDLRRFINRKQLNQMADQVVDVIKSTGLNKISEKNDTKRMLRFSNAW